MSTAAVDQKALLLASRCYRAYYAVEAAQELIEKRELAAWEEQWLRPVDPEEPLAKAEDRVKEGAPPRPEKIANATRVSQQFATLQRGATSFPEIMLSEPPPGPQ